VTPSDGADLFHPGEIKSSHEVVRNAVRRAIVSGALPGGSRLIQAELASQLGVSATPVREALRELASEGLVEFDRYRGAIVHETTADELRQIYAMRIALEPLAVARATGNLPDEDVVHARQLIAQMAATDDIPTFVELNREFHALLTEASRSRHMIAILRTLRDASALYVRESFLNRSDLMRTSNDEHAALLDAMVSGDAERATEISAAHFRNTLDSLNG
jgi:DNA-binding GntR family transcriptional regulator